jgi:hypothetical protein
MIANSFKFNTIALNPIARSLLFIEALGDIKILRY